MKPNYYQQQVRAMKMSQRELDALPENTGIILRPMHQSPFQTDILVRDTRGQLWSIGYIHGVKHKMRLRG